MRFVKIISIPVCIIGISFLLLYYYFGPSQTKSETIVFTVPESPAGYDAVAALGEKHIVKNINGFEFLYLWFSGGGTIKPGGYRLNKNMNAWQVMKHVTGKPDMLWVTISGCQRREQIGERLADVLGWNSSKLNDWNSAYTMNGTDYKEGVYYPDTYLIPTDEDALTVSKRFINRFNEKTAQLTTKFIQKNIKWTTGLKIASLIARESGGPDDMNLISGIIWNRLNQNMPLQIDATMQYTLGKKPDGTWWGKINLQEKQSDSPFNSYLQKGLPPTPICSPTIEAINAAINPENTDCLFYLHDRTREIHCSATYAGHVANIEKYLN